MAIRLITDSTADLSEEEQKRLGVEVAPLGVAFGDSSYLEGVEITRNEFYQKLRAATVLPTTTQVSPAAFEAVFAPAVAAGDELLVLCISGSISGTYQSAMIAAKEFPGARIAVIDTRNVSMCEGLLVTHAAKMRDEGASLEAIVAALEALKARGRLYAIIDDLSCLVKGGRLHVVGGIVGGLLQLKIIATIENGVVKLAGVARGLKKACRWVAQRALEEGVDAAYPLYFGHVDAPDLMAQLMALVTQDVPGRESRCRDIGAVIGSHAGPGAVGIAYICERG